MSRSYQGRRECLDPDTCQVLEIAGTRQNAEYPCCELDCPEGPRQEPDGDAKDRDHNDELAQPWQARQTDRDPFPQSSQGAPSFLD